MKTGNKITLFTLLLVVVATGASVFYVINNLVKNAIESYGRTGTAH